MGRKQQQPKPAQTPVGDPPPPAALSPFWWRVRVLGGVWFLAAGVSVAALALTNTSWLGVGVFAYVAVLGALLLVEAWRGQPPPAGVPAEVRPGWRMPITLHLLLEFLVMAAGFFGGAIVGAVSFIGVMAGFQALAGPADGPSAEMVRGTVSLLVVAPLFFGGAVFGLRTAQRLFNEYVPARCPRCGGPSYGRRGRPVTYHCAVCRHVYETIVHERR
jgi:hypothetical protein